MVSEEPRGWLRTADPAVDSITPVIERPLPSAVDLSEPAPNPPLSKIVLSGDPASTIVIVVEAETGFSPLMPDGHAALLLERMLIAIGLKSEAVLLLGIPKGAGARENFLRWNDGLQLGEQRKLLLLGEAAASIVSNEPMAKARGRVHHLADEKNSPLAVVSFAPSFLLQQPGMKRLAWADLQLFAGQCIQ